MSKLTLLFAVLAVTYVHGISDNWWRDVILYQVYPRSFKDSDGDGIGDLIGITTKLEHIKDIGADVVWLSPIYISPQADFGYDVTNFTDVNPEYGTLADFTKFITKAKYLGLRVILDFVPNHSSLQHPWFKQSVKKVKPYDSFYIWRDAKIVNGVREPPNNWLSAFTGSAWEWNEERGQYFLHQFLVDQPDLNYRNPFLNLAMKDALKFWLDRGVDGFRIDAINFAFEDKLFRDDPNSNISGIPKDDYDSLIHTYSRDQNETYGLIANWRKFMDNYSKKYKIDSKLLLSEAYTTLSLTIKYYDAGANAFNFMFITPLNKTSSASDFKRTIDEWLNNLPKHNVSNWVVGNHDQPRVASRYGVRRADMITMLAMILPGIAVVYNGDEIGMTNRNFTWEETVDIAGCNAGPERYHIKSRDPERIPFQWDNTTSAGFSTNKTTWLPVHENYITVNLAAQKEAKISHYQVFKALSTLKKKHPVLRNGTEEVILISEHVLGVVRRLEGSSPVSLLINFSERDAVIDAETNLNIPRELIVYVSSVDSNIDAGTQVDTSAMKLPGYASVMLASQSQVSELLYYF
ncbi:alpha-glucosidase-like [Belonocnema kinseyi]|uniref:alpha-glucosidase-like n=1 Tax=Belonocnema kinseyi TaxID=2817044 RepID=UPI00143CCA31|nr:alpha-glucosidase-like [Belonocnema kinseyi]